ncbi:MAG TPA: dihydropteroate synthase [Bacteroidia bacterium]|jgi:dihydropteroate synthase|nr:dihydropteroate synthase [Bacteroidia bacterium]
MKAQGTNFESKFNLRANGKMLSLEKPVVMGVLNLTPDSFYDGGTLLTEKDLLAKAEKHVKEGASILDLGAVSTKPNAAEVGEEEELIRLLPALKLLRKTFPNVFISVDTYRSNIAIAVANEGADIINDISGGTFDINMLETVVKLKLPYVIMHIQGTPQTMQQNPQYKNVVTNVFDFFTQQIKAAQQNGIEQLILDVGFGFGKTLEHNYELLAQLKKFEVLGFPLLAGVSRKSMVNKVIGTKPENALNGTTVVNTLALLNGANILRVHDVKEAMQVIQLVNCYHSV